MMTIFWRSLDFLRETTPVPLSGMTLRDVHLLHPVTFARYGGAIFKAGYAIEAVRVGANRATAVRFAPNATHDRMFRPGSSERRELAVQAIAKEFPSILALDLACCYRLLDLADVDASVPNVMRSRIRGELGRLGVRGLPVGGIASRLLAEGILSPVDHFLVGRQRSFARHMDDLAIGIQGPDDARAIILSLNKELRTFGAVLNKAKTRVLPSVDVLGGPPQGTVQDFRALLRTPHPDRMALGAGLRLVREECAFWEVRRRARWLRFLRDRVDAMFPVMPRAIYTMLVLSAGRLELPAVCDAIAKALLSPIPQHRSAAVRAVCSLDARDPILVRKLERLSEHDLSHFVRRDAILALARLEQSSSLRALRPFIGRRNKDAAVIAAAALGLPWRDFADTPYRILLWNAARDFGPRELPIASVPAPGRSWDREDRISVSPSGTSV